MADESKSTVEDVDPKLFYVTLRGKDGGIDSSLISVNHPRVAQGASSEKTQIDGGESGVDAALDFKSVLNTYRSAMDGYRNFIPLTLGVMSHLAYQMGFKNLQRIAEEKGVKLDDFSDDVRSVYQLDIEHYRECSIVDEKMEVAVRGARLLPEVMIIGLVSVYDSMLSRLLKVILNKHEKIVLTSDKTIKFSDLSAYKSIEDARQALIDKEIEAVLRMSHHEQFAWMESKFGIKLRADLSIWPDFIEICERRNLITHTGGVVSAQYLSNCTEHKADIGPLKLGDRLTVDSDYFSNAVDAIYEIGAKLCHVFWRRFSKEEREEADRELNDLGYAMIVDRNYKLGEALLQFGTKILKQHSSDKLRRMMIINLANSVRLQKRESDAKAILNKEDWSAVGDEFKLCVSAINGEVDDVVRLMKVLGASGPLSVEEYRSWPVFRGMRTNEKFTSAFQEIFGISLLAPKKAEVSTAELEASKDSSILESA